jgi:small subunit ribosomal protein S6
MFIFDSNRYARDGAGVAGEVEGLIQGIGGEILVSRLWDERRLAYPIEGQRKGAYWLTYFRVDSGEIGKLNRQCQISETILRHLVLKVDPRIVEAVVSHAQKSGQEKPAEETPRAAGRQPVGAGVGREEGGETQESEE